MSTLIITINGPFAYVDDYPLRGFITLMAPMCSQHAAGIAGIEVGNQYVFLKNKLNCRNHKSDFSDCSAHSYELLVNPGNVSSTISNGPFLNVPRPQSGFDPKQWRFWLTLPKPNIIVAVNPVEAVITTPGVQFTALPRYAVGARLIYTDWVFAPIPLLHCNEQVATFTCCNYGDDHAYLGIEYSGPVRDDPDHEDAVDCFENLMNALGLPWTVFIPAQTIHGIPESSKLNDCTAPVGWVGG